MGLTIHYSLKSATRSPKKARELVEGLKEERQRVLAVRDFVARSIRSSGPGLGGLPLEEIAPADRTLADGYGNSPDRAVLLHAMLEAVDKNPTFVLASSVPHIPYRQNPLREAPLYSSFPVVLVRVEVNGTEVYLNDTDQYAALGVTPHHRRLGLDLGTGRIRTILAAEKLRTRTETAYRIQLDESGAARITRRSRLYGTNFGASHRRYAEMRPEERDRHYQELVSAISESAEPDGKLTTDFAHYPGEVEFSVRASRFAVRDGQYLYFTVPGSVGGPPGVGGDRREGPLFWSSAREGVASATVVLPEGHWEVVGRPRDGNWEIGAGAGRFGIRFQSEGPRRLRIRREMSLQPAILPADSYRRLLRLQRELDHPRTRTILLRKTD